MPPVSMSEKIGVLLLHQWDLEVGNNGSTSTVYRKGKRFLASFSQSNNNQQLLLLTNLKTLGLKALDVTVSCLSLDMENVDMKTYLKEEKTVE
jgi:hypothetical protein